MLLKHRFGLVAAMALGLGLAACANETPAPAAAPPPAPAPMAQPAPPPPPAPMKGPQLTQAVQSALNANGANLKVDGRMGPKTHAALRSYQRAHHLRPTGRPDPQTLQALGIQG